MSTRTYFQDNLHCCTDCVLKEQLPDMDNDRNYNNSLHDPTCETSVGLASWRGRSQCLGNRNLENGLVSQRSTPIPLISRPCALVCGKGKSLDNLGSWMAGLFRFESRL